MIVVTGASGQLGRRTIQLLREEVEAARIVALSRTPERVADLGVAVRPADFDAPDGLVRAFDGADRLLIVSTHDLRPGGHRIRQHTNAVRAAAQAGVGHVIYTSVVRAGDPENTLPVAPDHRETERALAEAGLTYTILRNNLYAELLLWTAPSAVASGVLANNIGDGRIGYVAREDCAAVAAVLLADGGHDGRILDVTGPVAVSQAEIATTISGITSRPVRYQAQSDEEARAWLPEHGVPAPMAETITAFNRATRAGWLDVTSDVVRAVTGRPATSTADFLAANRGALA